MNVRAWLVFDKPTRLFLLSKFISLPNSPFSFAMSGDNSGIHYSKLDLSEASDDTLDVRRESSIESHLDPNITGGYSPQPDAIIPEQGRFPFCIVWTPLPLITCVVKTTSGFIYCFSVPNGIFVGTFL